MSISPPTNRSSVQSITRVIDILEVLSTVPQGMTLSDLAAATGLHISTVHRLVNTLADRGYARKDGNTGKYRLTLRMFEIGSRVSNCLDLLDLSRNYLEELAAFSGEAVHLVERDGDSVVYLYKFEPFLRTINTSSYVGCRNPMHCIGVGKAILALLPEREAASIWERTEHSAYTPNTIVDWDTLRQDLARTRLRGFALDNGEHEVGVYCVAAAIRDWEGRPIGAISISTPVTRMTDELAVQHGEKLIEVADEISRLLGRVTR